MNEIKRERRADDKRPAGTVDWTDAPRFTALGIAETWSVAVEAEGQCVLRISDRHVAGLDGERLKQFAPTIRSCAQHLLGFIGSTPAASTADAANGGMTLAKQFGYPEIAPEAPMQGGITKDAFEEIARGWDGCRYDDAMIDDIGAALRLDFDRLATTAGEQAEPGDLHNAIMNLPEKAPYDRVRHESEYKAYKIGHRDARHAAAQLANEFATQAASAAPEQVQAAFFRRSSEFGPWIECGPNEAGAVRFLAAPSGAQVQAVDKHLPDWEREISTVTLTGHQLRAALDFINPDGEDDLDQLDGELTFGIVQHLGDDGNASAGLCCWNDDTDGVLPLDGDYVAAPSAAAPAAPEQDEVRNQALEDVAKLIDKKVENYSNEHGIYDHTTGVTEYPGDGAEWLCEMEELAEEIRALKNTGSPTATAAVRDVLAERRRQVEIEGWHPDQDDDYEDGQLSMAAACYATQGNTPNYGPPDDWPWDKEWWKPTDDRRNLVKAGALILADIERIDRAMKTATNEGDRDAS